MANYYYLMNKDEKVLLFREIQDRYGESFFENCERYHAPLPVSLQGIPNQHIGSWLQQRKVPSHRRHIKKLLDQLGMTNLQGYIDLSHATSLNDTFWVKKADSDIRWPDVSLYCNPFDDVVAQIAFDGILSDFHFSSFSPEFSTDGAYAKCWKREKDGNIYLIKRGNEAFGQPGCEPYSEYYAAQIAEILCPKRIPYDLEPAAAPELNRGKSIPNSLEVVSKCRLFTSEQIGFLPFAKLPGEYHYLSQIEDVYKQYHCLEEFRRMIVLDAVILNTDRHQGNHGFFIDNAAQEILGMAPVFDHNQSLLSDLTNDQFWQEADLRVSTKAPKLGIDFIKTAARMLTPEIAEDLKHLFDFHFKRHPLYNLPEDRLQKLEQIVANQASQILSCYDSM